MKKLLFIAGVAAACSAFAAVETVTGTTEVGMLSIASSAKNCIVAVPYLELATGENICVSNIVKTANLAANDELYVYNDGSWTAWVLKEDAGKAKYWDKVGIASIGANGKPVLGASEAASDVTAVPGGAVWLTRKNPTSAPFYVYGGYTNVLKTIVSATAKTLVANPTASSVAITGKINPAIGDTIWELADDGVGMTQYIYGTTNAQVAASWYVKNGTKYTKPSKLPALAPGCGVWMKLKNGGTINW